MIRTKMQKKLSSESNMVSHIGILFATAKCLTVLASLVFFLAKSAKGLFCCGALFSMLEISRSMRRLKNEIAYTLFLCSFFIFLQGRFLVNLAVDGELCQEFNSEITLHIMFSLMLSLIALSVTYSISSHFSWIGGAENGQTSSRSNDADQNDLELKVSLLLFYGSALFAILSQIDAILFVRDFTYVEYYLSYSSHLPRVLQVFANMYNPLFLLYLCMYPAKDKVRNPFLVYLLISLLTLAAGDRGGAIQNISILLVYCLWREGNSEVKWVSRKLLVVVFVLSPLIMALLSLFVHFREGIDVGQMTISAQLQRFLSIAGRSANVLGYAIEYKDWLPLNHYTFGGLIDYVVYNPISSFFFGTVRPRPQTVEFAMSMHSFDSALSLFVYPQTYFNGHGIGSSYIAEVYHDYGYFGVIAINVVYAILLDGYKRFLCAGSSCKTMTLLIIRSLFYAPRGPALIFLTNLLNITTIAAFILHSLLRRAVRRPVQREKTFRTKPWQITN